MKQEEKAAPGVVGREPTMEERVGALEWKIEILRRVIARLDKEAGE